MAHTSVVQQVLAPVPLLLVGQAMSQVPDLTRHTSCEVVSVVDESGSIVYDVGRVPSDAASRLPVMGDRHAERRLRDTFLG